MNFSKSKEDKKIRLFFFQSLINRKSIQEKQLCSRSAKLFFFQRYFDDSKIYRIGCFFLLFRTDTRSRHLARFLLFWTGQRNRKTTVSNRCRLSRFPRPVMNILFYLPFTRLRALRPMTCLLTSTIACTNVDRPFLSGPNTDLSIFIRLIMLAFTRHAYHDFDW